MNPRAVHLALIVGAVGALAYLAFLAFFTVLSGCAAGLPPEPPYVEITTKDASRAGR